jgi:hypothetical protein
MVSTTPATSQVVYGDISSGKDLKGKIAGNDATGQHKDWTTEFYGWPHPDVDTPESLVRQWFWELEMLAIDRANNMPVEGPDGFGDLSPIDKAFVNADGQDLQQLIQKFLLGAIGISQGADDYLDDDTAGKGLLAAHSTQDDEDNFSPLEHAWDEGFGYFGASRDYATRSFDEIADDHYVDFDGDMAIDLKSEYDFGNSQNAAKRDRGAVVASSFTADAFNGFHAGRTLLASIEGELTDAELDELRGHRDQALGAWEGAVAATVVHYINDTLQDMGKFGTEDYSFTSHAKHWGELKGFALGFQFNPHSVMSDADFETFHDLVGTAPVLPSHPQADIDAYHADLLEARELMGSAYGFAPENLGDDNGENGW